MGSEFDNETANDMNYDKARASALSDSISVDRCESYRIGGRATEYLLGKQCGRLCHRRRNKAMRTLLVIGTVVFTICISAPRSPSIFVDSFSFKLFHRSDGRRHKTLKETTTQILSASSAEEDIENMNNSFENSVKKSKYENSNNINNNSRNKNSNLPSLVDWKIDIDGNRITGRSVNHPFVPDGELITTACLDPSCMDGAIEAGNVVSTIQGTTYELLKPPPVGSSYFATTKEASTQVFKEDIFSYTTTGLPYDEQLAFLEELTNMVKIKQAAEAGTNAAVSESPLSPPVTNQSGASASSSVFATSSPAMNPLQSTQVPRGVEETQAEIFSSIEQPELMQKNQQAPEQSPQRPTFSINKSLQNQDRKLSKGKSSPNSNKIDDNNGNLLGGVATVAAAAAAAAGVTLGGQTGLANDLLDEAKRQAEAQIPPQTKEVLASVNAQVEDTSRVVLPYLEEQIRIAEAKVEEARLEEKAKTAWNGVADYLNGQSGSTASKKAATTFMASSEAKKSLDYSAVEEVASTSNIIAGSTTPAVGNKAKSFEKSPEKPKFDTIGTTTGTERTIGTTDGTVEKQQLSVEVPSAVQAETSVTNDFVKETASTTQIIEEVASITPAQRATATAIEEVIAGGRIISSNYPQSLAVEQTSQGSEQIKTKSEATPETSGAEAIDKTEVKAGAMQEQADASRVQTSAKVKDDVVQDIKIEEAKAEAAQVQTTDKIESETVQVEAAVKVEAQTEAVEVEGIEKIEVLAETGKTETDRIKTAEKVEAEAESVQLQAMGKVNVEAEAESLQVQDADKVEAEAEVLRVRAMAEEQQLTEAARIIEEQLEVARREVEEAAVGSSDILSGVKMPLVAGTNVAKVEVVKGSEPFAKSPPSVVETFGGNFVVAQEESKLGNAAVSSTVSASANVDFSESNVEKPSFEMVKNAINVEVKPVVDTSSNSAEQTSNSAVEENMKGADTELSESLVAGRSILESEMKAPKTVETRQSLIGKVTEMLEKGKKTTETIGNGGRDAIDTGKRTVQGIKTTGQKMINTGKRTYEAAVDTGLKVIDTGKRTAKAIEETGQMVGVKGKEAYETGQEYARIGKEILQDEEKVKGITTGTAVAGVAAAFATNSFKDALSDKGGDDTESEIVPLNGTNETFAKLQNNGENFKNQIPFSTPESDNNPSSSKSTTQKTIEPEMLSSMPSSKSESSSRIGLKTNNFIDTTSTERTDVKKSGSPFGSPPKQAVPGKQVEFGVPFSKSSTFDKKSVSPFGSPPKQDTPNKKVEFGAPSAKSSTFGKKASPFESPPKQDTPSSSAKAAFGVPSSKSSAFGKKASPFGVSPKQATPDKKVGLEVPSSKSSHSKKQAVPSFGSFSKQPDTDKTMGSKVPLSKNDDAGKRVVPSFGSSPNQSPSDEVEVGVSSQKKSKTDNPESSFGSFPKGSSIDKNSASTFGLISEQTAPGKNTGVGEPSSKSSTFGKKTSSPFGSPPKQALKFPPSPFLSKSPVQTEGTKKFGIVPPKSLNNKETTGPQIPRDEIKLDPDKAQDTKKFQISREGGKGLPLDDTSNQKALPKFGIPPRTFPSKNTETLKEESWNSANFGGQSKQVGLESAKNSSLFGEGEMKSPFPSKAMPTLNFDAPSKKAGVESAKSPLPFGKGKMKSSFQPKAIPTSSFDGSSKKTGKESAKATSRFVKGEMKSPLPPKAVPTSNFDCPPNKAVVESTKSTSPFRDNKIKPPFSSKAIPSSSDGPNKVGVESTKSTSSFGKGIVESPFPPKAISTSSLNGPSQKADVESEKSTLPFGKGKMKSPFPPKPIPTSSFDGSSKKTGKESAKTISPFGESKSKSPFPQNVASGKKADFASSATDMLSKNKTTKKTSKKIDRSYFTDTSRNGYDKYGRTASNDGAEYGNDSNDDNKKCPVEQNLAKETSSSDEMDPLSAEPVCSSRSPIDDDRGLREESTYLTEENQKRFFPQPSSSQEVELGYRVGASINENQGQRNDSMFLTEEKDGILSPKKSTPLSPQSDDPKPRITSIDESALNGNDGLYGKSPDELMAEVMRIAREQEGNTR